MLSPEDNEILCRVGSGTPMGELLRRFWLPAVLASELPGPDSDPLRLRIESGPVMNFPAGQTVGRADFYFATGVGEATGADPIATNPSVEISWSDDGGVTWSIPVIRKLGRQASPQQLVSLVSCSGRTRWMGRRWRIDISDPVYASFLYGTQSDDPRAV